MVETLRSFPPYAAADIGRSAGWVSVADIARKATRDSGAAHNPPANRARCADGGLRRMPSEMVPGNRHMRLTHPTNWGIGLKHRQVGDFPLTLTLSPEGRGDDRGHPGLK